MKKEDEKRNNESSQYITDRIEIDCVIFNFEDEILKVLLVKQTDDKGNENWGLAKDWLKEGETLASTAHNILKKYIHQDNFFLEQLKAFGYPSPLSLKEEISIGYYAMFRSELKDESNSVLSQNTKWVSANEIQNLNEKHQIIVECSLNELRKNICKSVIGFNLLPEKFTLLQVVHLYEEILGIEINKSNFRRKILQMGIVSDLDEKEEDVSHRAAKFYTLNLKNDKRLYQRELNFNFY